MIWMEFESEEDFFITLVMHQSEVLISAILGNNQIENQKDISQLNQAFGFLLAQKIAC